MIDHYCPCCGTTMDAIVCTFEYPTHTKSIVQVTCYESGCQFKTYTVSPATANNAATLRDIYHVVKLYDVYTGEKVANG